MRCKGGALCCARRTDAVERDVRQHEKGPRRADVDRPVEEAEEGRLRCRAASDAQRRCTSSRRQTCAWARVSLWVGE
eukprot:1723287-Pleurochrysis_carterae.AAC.3